MKLLQNEAFKRRSSSYAGRSLSGEELRTVLTTGENLPTESVLSAVELYRVLERISNNFPFD